MKLKDFINTLYSELGNTIFLVNDSKTSENFFYIDLDQDERIKEIVKDFGEREIVNWEPSISSNDVDIIFHIKVK